MNRNTLFIVSLIFVSSLAAYVAHGMFDVGVMPEYERSKMYFAAAVLAFLAFIFILSMLLYSLGPEVTPSSNDSPGKSIFDACVKVIPPLVTLIIGFYFGISQGDSQTALTEKSAAASSSATDRK